MKKVINLEAKLNTLNKILFINIIYLTLNYLEIKSLRKCKLFSKISCDFDKKNV